MTESQRKKFENFVKKVESEKPNSRGEYELKVQVRLIKSDLRSSWKIWKSDSDFLSEIWDFRIMLIDSPLKQEAIVNQNMRNSLREMLREMSLRTFKSKLEMFLDGGVDDFDLYYEYNLI